MTRQNRPSNFLLASSLCILLTFLLQACATSTAHTPIEPIPTASTTPSALAPAAAAAPVALAPTSAPAPSQSPSFRTIIWAGESSELADFDRAAAHAKSLGATHMVITAGLPRSFWQFDTPNDPYPAWYDFRPGLFKVFPPEALRPYIPADYSNRVADILAQRCAILRKYGLQGMYLCNEPQVLPEAVFHDHPLWRGPRVDHANRSRTARFAPCVDEPEVLALYRQSMALLIRRCPEITLFQFVTTDAGSGLCWAPGLYPGVNGPEACKRRPMAQRVRDFMFSLQDGAKDAGTTIEIRMLQISPEEWMTPTFDDPAAIARQLRPGLAIDNFEGPNATPFMANAGGNSTWRFFYPVRQIPQPVDLLASLRESSSSRAPRLNLAVPLGCDDLYAKIYERFKAHPPTTTAEQYQLLQDIAADQVGPANAEELVAVWQAISKAAEYGNLLNWCYPSTLGAVHQRWLTRPFIPFPAELPADQKAYYRKFLFQARSEEQADDLVDCQAMRLYEGWPGRMFITNVYNRVDPQLASARRHLATLLTRLPQDRRQPYILLDLRLHAFQYLCTNARNAVNYQAVLDYIKGKNLPPEANPPLGVQSSWDRQMIQQVARSEIDNSAALMVLLRSAPEPLLDSAPTAAEEDVTLLGPNLIQELQTKIDLMNAHWEDYKRITTTPNP